MNKRIGVVFAIGGSATFWVDEKRYQLTVGDWLIMPVGTRYRAHTDDFFEFYSITFSTPLEIVEQIPASFFISPENYSAKPYDIASDTIYLTDKIETLDCMPELMRICSEMHRLILHPGVTERLMFDLYFGQLLLLLSTKVVEKKQNPMPFLMKQAIDYIHENFQQPLSLEGLCERMHVSKSYLSRLFRKYLGMTVTSYINSVKLDYAAQLLGGSTMNISETAEYIGYQDAAYFSRIFRKRFGISPIKFRLSHLSDVLKNARR